MHGIVRLGLLNVVYCSKHAIRLLNNYTLFCNYIGMLLDRATLLAIRQNSFLAKLREEVL